MPTLAAEWEQEELARMVGVPVDVVAKKMMLWVNQGVVKLTVGLSGGRQYVLIDQQEAPQVRD